MENISPDDCRKETATESRKEIVLFRELGKRGEGNFDSIIQNFLQNLPLPYRI